jgi:hypothetical protein
LVQHVKCLFDSMMTPFEISAGAFAIIFISTLVGMRVKRYLPPDHLSEESRDVIKLGTGLIATMAALALGLLINSAKGTFDTINNGLKRSGSKVVLLDRTLAQYGPEAKEAREKLRNAVAKVVGEIWRTDSQAIALEKVRGDHTLEELIQILSKLTPQDEEQHRLRTLAVLTTGDVMETRLLIMEHIGQTSFPMPLLGLLVLWLAIIFFSFGLLSVDNKTVTIVLLVCALSVASALFVLLELDQPFGGLIKASSGPLQTALSLLAD